MAKWETAVRRISENMPIMYLICKSDLKRSGEKIRNAHEISIKNNPKSVSSFFSKICEKLNLQ
jgi:hypothetical protein